MKLKQLVIVTLVLTLMLGAPKTGVPQEKGKPATLAMMPCEIQGVEGKARCGDYEVFENGATKKGGRSS